MHQRMRKALQFVGSLTLFPDRIVVREFQIGVSRCGPRFLRRPNARPDNRRRPLGLWAVPHPATMGQGEGLQLGQEIGAHGLASRRIPEAKVDAYSLASLQAKSKV